MTTAISTNIRVLFPTNFTPREWAGTEQNLPLAEIISAEEAGVQLSDDTLKNRVVEYLNSNVDLAQLPDSALREMIVQRPEEDVIMITAKTRFGGFTCEYCGAEFVGYDDLVRHLKYTRHEV